MQIFVSTDFPNPKSFLDIIHAVAERFSERMIHKSIILGKLATLEVYLNPLIPTEEDYKMLEARKAAYAALGDTVPRVIRDGIMNETVYDVLQSGGYHQTMCGNDCVYSKIVLNVHPDEHSRQFAYLVAHEMTHMLVCGSFNYCVAGEPVECGSVPGASSINRWIPESTTCYGEFMEEIAVHTVAEWLVQDMDLPPEREDSNRIYYPEFSQIEMCNLLADAFGTPLKALRYLDAFSVTDKGVEFPNVFWYAFAVNRFGWIISIFNEIIGDGSYERLCNYIDARDDETDEKAREMMREFARKYQEECRTEETWQQN